jgi:hypothetical protein
MAEFRFLFKEADPSINWFKLPLFTYLVALKAYPGSIRTASVNSSV